VGRRSFRDHGKPWAGLSLLAWGLGGEKLQGSVGMFAIARLGQKREKDAGGTWARDRMGEKAGCLGLGVMIVFVFGSEAETAPKVEYRRSNCRKLVGNAYLAAAHCLHIGLNSILQGAFKAVCRGHWS